MGSEPGTPNGGDVNDLLDFTKELDSKAFAEILRAEGLNDSAISFFMETRSSIFKAIQINGPPSTIEAVLKVQAANIAERHKTRRMGFVVSAVLTLASAAILVFAPENRETVAQWVGAALFIAPAGAAGFTHARFKMPGTSLKLGSKR